MLPMMEWSDEDLVFFFGGGIVIPHVVSVAGVWISYCLEGKVFHLYNNFNKAPIVLLNSPCGVCPKFGLGLLTIYH